MNDAELREQFIRVEPSERGARILVCTIDWDDPHTPVSTWVEGRIMARDTPAADLDRAIDELLAHRRYFRVCEECGERNPDGWMHTDRICQRCAETNHGVVH